MPTTDHTTPVTVISGLARCGSTAIMQILSGPGGIPPYHDRNAPDLGTKKALGLPDKSAWLAACQGRAVKLLDVHRRTPPPLPFPYRVIWVDRNITELAKSVGKLTNAVMGIKPSNRNLRKWRGDIRTNRRRSLSIWQEDLNASILIIRFEELLSQPQATITTIADHLHLPDLDVAYATDTIHQRSPLCQL